MGEAFSIVCCSVTSARALLSTDATARGAVPTTPFFFTARAPTEIYTLSLHDALPIFSCELTKLDVEHVVLEKGRIGQTWRDRWASFCPIDRKSTRLNSSHRTISYAVFCLKKKKIHGLLRCPVILWYTDCDGRGLLDRVLLCYVCTCSPVDRCHCTRRRTHNSFFFHCSRAHRDLHSFPTRRSSDLQLRADQARRRACCSREGKDRANLA